MAGQVLYVRPRALLEYYPLLPLPYGFWLLVCIIIQAGVAGCDIQGIGSDEYIERHEDPIPSYRYQTMTSPSDQP